MKLISNNIEIPVDEKADIIIEKFSPILNLDVKGEYALSFTNQITPELQQAMGFSNLPNIQNPVSKIPVALIGDSLAFLGNLTTQAANRKEYQQQLTATPGGVPLDIWTRKLTEIDFGKDTIPTTETTTNFHQILTKNTGTTTDKDFISFLNSLSCDVEIYFGNTKVYNLNFLTFQAEYISPTEQTRTAELMNGFNEFAPDTLFPNSTLTITTDEVLFYVPYNIESVRIIINRKAVTWASVPALAVTYTMNRINYQSIGNYYDNSLLPTWDKPYLFPPIYAPNAYGSSNPSFNGTLNNLNGSEYYYNAENSPTIYAFCPVFSFQYIIKTLLNYMGYTLNPSFFSTDNNDKLYWLTMVLADQQCPNVSKPFNIHASEIIYKNYLPSWTVKEFIEYFQNWQNVYFTFDVFSKTATINHRQEFITNPENKQVIDIQYLTDDDYTASPITNEAYQIKYTITDSDDESLTLPLFEAFPKTQTAGIDWKTIENNFAPLIFSTDYTPINARTRGTGNSVDLLGDSIWNWQYTGIVLPGITPPTTPSANVRTGIITCYQSARSVLFSKSTEEVKSRSLFCGTQSGTILTENTLNNKTLFITGTTGIYEKSWKQYLNAITNTIEILVKVSLPNITLHQFDFSSIFHAFNMAWLSNQISINPKLRASIIRLRRIKPS
jgi:hypothetical protein